jgi:hypothetical protein
MGLSAIDVSPVFRPSLGLSHRHLVRCNSDTGNGRYEPREHVQQAPVNYGATAGAAV